MFTGGLLQPLHTAMKTIAPGAFLVAFGLTAAAAIAPVSPADQMLARYFEAETAALESKCLGAAHVMVWRSPAKCEGRAYPTRREAGEPSRMPC